MKVHIVQKGDTLWKIARQYGISFEDLKKANAHLANPDYIVPGMKIFLPIKNEKPTTQQPEKKKKPVERPTQEQPSRKKEELSPEPERPKEMPREPQREAIKDSQGYPQGMPQMVPMMGFPCHWMPVYDADCNHHMPNMPPTMPPAMPRERRGMMESSSLLMPPIHRQHEHQMQPEQSCNQPMNAWQMQAPYPPMMPNYMVPCCPCCMQPLQMPPQRPNFMN